LFVILPAVISFWKILRNKQFQLFGGSGIITRRMYSSLKSILPMVQYQNLPPEIMG
jgi:hypothetical protein